MTMCPKFWAVEGSVRYAGLCTVSTQHLRARLQATGGEGRQESPRPWIRMFCVSLLSSTLEAWPPSSYGGRGDSIPWQTIPPSTLRGARSIVLTPTLKPGSEPPPAPGPSAGSGMTAAVYGSTYCVLGLQPHHLL